MSKKLGVVTPEAPPVDPLKNQPQGGLGAIVSREVSIQPPAPPVGLGTVKTDHVTVTVEAPPPAPIGQVRETVIAAPPPPPPAAPPVGVVQDRTPQLSAAPVHENAQPIGVVRQAVHTGINAAPPPPPVGQIHEPEPLYPPASAQVTALPSTVGKVVENVVNVQIPAPSNQPEKVISIALPPKPIIEQPVEISPFRREE